MCGWLVGWWAGWLAGWPRSRKMVDLDTYVVGWLVGLVGWWVGWLAVQGGLNVVSASLDAD